MLYTVTKRLEICIDFNIEILIRAGCGGCGWGEWRVGRLEFILTKKISGGTFIRDPRVDILYCVDCST